MSKIGMCASSTGNFNIVALDHMKKLKNIAFVGNTGHFDNEINFAALTVDEKMAKFHISRSVQLWCGDRAGSASDKKSTLGSYQMAVPGQRRIENPR